jgi:hypothetical protein
MNEKCPEILRDSMLLQLIISILVPQWINAI